MAGREDGGANGGETKTGSSEIVKVALERTAGFSPRLSAGAGGERAGTGTEGGGSEDLAGDRLGGCCFLVQVVMGHFFASDWGLVHRKASRKVYNITAKQDSLQNKVY